MKQFAFIDEYGNYGFDFSKSDVSRYFIIIAILVKEENLVTLEEELEGIRKFYFQTGEIKSSKVRINSKRRELIINKIKGLPFNLYGYIIDKKEIYDNSSLKHKKIFFKHLNNLLYKDLIKAFQSIEIYADEHGTKEFMDEFKKYILKKNQPNLFEEPYIDFKNSKSNVCLQLADFIAGTVGMEYENKTITSGESISFLYPLKNKIININIWPPKFTNLTYDYSTLKQNQEFNEIITKQAINSIVKYIEDHEEIEEEIEGIRVQFLKILLTNFFLEPYSYILTNEILEILNRSDSKRINQQQFRNNVVAKIRDSGVIIASSTKGYKIPVTEKDLLDYANVTNTQIIPMIDRIARCRSLILLATNNELDILEREEFTKLKNIILR